MPVKAAMKVQTKLEAAGTVSVHRFVVFHFSKYALIPNPSFEEPLGNYETKG